MDTYFSNIISKGGFSRNFKHYVVERGSNTHVVRILLC